MYKYLILITILIISCEKKYVELDASISNFPDSLFSNVLLIGDDKHIEINVSDTLIKIISLNDTLNYPYSEYHKYRSKKDSVEFTVPIYKSDKESIIRHPKSGEPMSIEERVSCIVSLKNNNNDTRVETYCLNSGEYLFNSKGNALDTSYLGLPIYLFSSGDIIGPLIIRMDKSKSRKVLPDGYWGIDIDMLEGLSGNCIEFIMFDFLKSIYSKNKDKIMRKDSTYVMSLNQISKFNEQIKVKISYSPSVTFEIVNQIGKMLNFINISNVDLVEIKEY